MLIKLFFKNCIVDVIYNVVHGNFQLYCVDNIFFVWKKKWNSHQKKKYHRTRDE